MSIDLEFVELTADVLEIFFILSTRTKIYYVTLFDIEGLFSTQT